MKNLPTESYKNRVIVELRLRYHSVMTGMMFSAVLIVVGFMIITLTSAVFHFIVGFLLAENQETSHIIFNHAFWLLPFCLVRLRSKNNIPSQKEFK